MSRTPKARSAFGFFSVLMLGFGLVFLYTPILILILYSFNASRLVTVWGGFSTKWYGELFADRAMLRAAWVSARVALASATLAAILGTAAGHAMARHPGRRASSWLSGLIAIPLALPDVILGLSLLLLFVACSVPRGIGTIIVAHATLGMAYVAVIVRARLSAQDRSLEEAAMDLGAPPVRAFFTITLPLMMPAVAAGWLLAFSLSLDDLILASFASGPGATTLPMKIYSQVRLGVTPEINALCTILVGLVTVGVLIAIPVIAAKRSGAAGLAGGKDS